MLRLALLTAASLTFAAIPSSVSAGCSDPGKPDCSTTCKNYQECTKCKTIDGNCDDGVCKITVDWDCSDSKLEKKINNYCKKHPDKAFVKAGFVFDCDELF